MVAGKIPVESPEVIQEGVEVCDIVAESLEDGLDTISPKTHEVLRRLHLPFIAGLHERVPMAEFPAVCSDVGMTPYELFSHGMTARRMIDERDVELKIID